MTTDAETPLDTDVVERNASEPDAGGPDNDGVVAAGPGAARRDAAGRDVVGAETAASAMDRADGGDVGTVPAATTDDPAVAAGYASQAAAETVEHDIDALVAERDQYRDIALRLQADFENYRKRVAAQGDAEVDRATGKLAESLLPVLDACEAGFAHGAAGVEPIWSALMGALQRQGLEAMDLVGQAFDPALAEAVVHEPGDGAESSVADVLRTGYVWKGRVLRPAMVKVQG